MDIKKENDVTSVFNEEGNHWDISLSGEFDIFNSSDFKVRLTQLAKEKSVDMFIDCTGVTFLDSTALGSLVAVLKNVKSYEGRIVIKNLRPNILRLFKITNLDRVFEIAEAQDGDK